MVKIMNTTTSFYKAKNDTLRLDYTDGTSTFVPEGEKTGIWFQYCCWLCTRPSGRIFYSETHPPGSDLSHCPRCKVKWLPRHYSKAN